MEFSIDSAIFAIFLIFNLGVGLFYGTNIKNIREYAVGNKDFSTATLTATIIATCIGGGFFSGAIAESYRQGLYFMIPAMGEPLSLIVTGYFLAPRMGEFLGTLSVAEALGNLYGKTVQKIAAISSILLCIGIVSLQFKVAATIMQVFFGVSSFYAVLISATVVVLYSAFGGIKAVTFTDVIQFFTFGTIVPIIAFIIWGTFKDPYLAFAALQTNPLLNLSEVFDITNAKFLSTFFLLLFFLLPDLQPVFYQRIVMAKSPLQARKSFMIAGSITLLILFVTMWIGVLLLSDNPSLDPNNLLAFIIQKYSYPGLKGLTAIGIMAIIMSTADSYINTASVLFTNDIVESKDSDSGETAKLLLPRICALVVGVASFFLAFKASSILNLLIIVLSFYAPVVTIPLVMAILGFRSTYVSVLIGITAGISTVALFNIVDFGVEGVIPGMLANLVFLVGSHYILRQEGGFVGIKDYGPVLSIRRERARNAKKLLNSIINFNFFEFCRKQKPSAENTFPLFGVFCLISIFSTMYSLPSDIRHRHDEILTIIYDVVLICSSIFLTYPVWPKTLKNDTFISILWTLGVPFTLVFVHGLLVVISNFGQFQLMTFMINQIVIAIMLRWYVALISTILGVYAAIKYNALFIGSADILNLDIDLKFKIFYMLLLISSVMIAFIKPKQDYHDNAEATVEHLNHQAETREEELMRAVELKYEFLRNINHEIRTPVHCVRGISSELNENWDKFSDEERKTYTKAVAESSERLLSLIYNLLDFSNLSSDKVELNFEKFDLSELVEEEIEKCKKYNYQNIEFELIAKIEPGIIIEADKYYIAQLIDNLVINSFKYRKNSLVEIVLKTNKDDPERPILLTVKDGGIGIPENELTDIFIPFRVSSKTRTPAGGRGMGLAVCQKVVKVHGGTIQAESDGVKGTLFRVKLPLNK